MTGLFDRMPFGPTPGPRALTPEDFFALGHRVPTGMRHRPAEEVLRYVRTANFDVPADVTKAQLEGVIRIAVTRFLEDITRQGWPPLQGERVKVYPLGPPREGLIPFEIKAICTRQGWVPVPDAQALTDLLQRKV